MKTTKRQAKTAPARETTYTVIYPDGQVVIMHNSSPRFDRVLDRNKKSGAIKLWIRGDHKDTLSYLTFRPGPRAPEVSHPFRNISNL